jgi:hypothetical protein
LLKTLVTCFLDIDSPILIGIFSFWFLLLSKNKDIFFKFYNKTFFNNYEHIAVDHFLSLICLKILESLVEFEEEHNFAKKLQVLLSVAINKQSSKY